jgi:hypothetical protein
MAGLAPAIHVFCAAKQSVDGRDKPGHDDEKGCLIQSNRRIRTRMSGGVGEGSREAPLYLDCDDTVLPKGLGGRVRRAA